VVVRGHQFAQAPQPFRDDVEHRAVGRQGHVLLEPRAADTGLQPDGS
jgi:hypothetical protein